MENEFEIIVKTFKGFEPTLEKEIKSLTNNPLKSLNRGFSLMGTKEDLYKLNYHLTKYVIVAVNDHRVN